MKRKIYDHIKLGWQVPMPGTSANSPNHIGEIVAIENMTILAGISEPIFVVKYRDFRQYFGLKYILKMAAPPLELVFFTPHSKN